VSNKPKNNEPINNKEVQEKKKFSLFKWLMEYIIYWILKEDVYSVVIQHIVLKDGIVLKNVKRKWKEYVINKKATLMIRMESGNN
jgi:hypothetical protein